LGGILVWETSEPIAMLPGARSLLLFLRRYFATVYRYELVPVYATASAPNLEKFKGKVIVKIIVQSLVFL